MDDNFRLELSSDVSVVGLYCLSVLRSRGGNVDFSFWRARPLVEDTKM